MRVFRGLGRRIGLALFVAGLVLSPNVWQSVKVLTLAGEGAIAQYRLGLIPPEEYLVEIRAALVARDGDLARSLIALAKEQKVVVPPELEAELAALPVVDPLNVLGQGWNCVVNGDFDSEAGFACVVATDLTGIGDVRDLVAQGGNYVAGQPVNYLTLGLATAGLSLSAATLATGGAVLPLRAGTSFLKAVNKLGKVPPRLANEVGSMLARGLNRGALDETLVLAREFRLGELGAPLGRLFNPRAVAALTDLAADFGTIGKVGGGVRAMRLSVEAVESTRDVKVLAKTAERFQDRFTGVMKMLGKRALHLVDLMWRIGGWLVAAMLWLVSMAWFLLRATTATAKFTGRMGSGMARAMVRRRMAG